MKNLIVLVGLAMLGGLTQASDQGTRVRGGKVEQPSASQMRTMVRKDVPEERGWKCLFSRTKAMLDGTKTGGVVCLTPDGNAAFVGSGTVSNPNGYSSVVTHLVDGNGKNEKCANDHSRLPTCQDLWVSMTKAHYGPRYSAINAQLRDMNKPQ